MMETQFTPGKWKAKEHKEYISIRAMRDGDSIEISSVGCPELGNQERANAALISAAPDMFKFIEEVIASGPNSGYIYKRALELIAQATTF